MPEKITNNVTQNKAGETVNTAKYQNDGEITMSNNGFSSVDKKENEREREKARIIMKITNALKMY